MSQKHAGSGGSSEILGLAAPPLQTRGGGDASLGKEATL